MPLACPSCGRTIAIKDPKPGRFRVPCPQCGQPFLLKVGDGPDPAMDARPLDPESIDESPSETSPHPDAWGEARSLLSRFGAATRERLGWAWKALRSRSSSIGGTLILQELGRTSRGTLARGRQILLGRDVLVRTLPGDWGGVDAVSRARAEREAYVSAELIHPNLVRRLDSGVDRGRRFEVEVAIEGSTLAALAGRGDWLGGDAAIAPVLHAARGLLAAHQQGFSHGDPSPEQIWLDEGGGVRLAGLGLGRLDPESKDGEGPFASRAIGDVKTLGHALDTLRLSQREAEGRDSSKAADIARRMIAAGSDDGFRDLAQAVEAMERALGIPAGSTFLPRDEEASRLAGDVSTYHAAPLAPLRSKLILGFFFACAAFTLLFGRAGNFGLAGGTLGLCGMTAAVYALLRAGIGRRAGVFGRLRELVLGGRRADWLTLLAAVLVGVGVLFALGWLAGWIALGVVAAMFAVGFVVAVDAPIARDREAPLADARSLLANMRVRGVSEVALREFARAFGGERWDEMFEALFGLEETRRARAARGQSHPGRLRLDGWRFAALGWLDARLLARREAAARARFEPIEEAALVARKTNEMTARRKSRRVAEALIVVAREVRAASLAALAPDGDASTILVTPRPIPDLIREAVETPDRLLTSTWSDDREPERGPNPLLRLLAAATGPRVRFLLGGLLMAGFLLWADQVGIISSTEIRAKAEEAIAGRDVGRLSDVNVDLERAQGAADPLVLPGVPRRLTRFIAGYGVGAAGLILLASSFVAGSRIALFALPGAAIALFGARLGLPSVGPLPAPALASAVGAGLLAIGLAFGRR